MSERLRELLLKAVRGLDPSEQDEVFGELLMAGNVPMPYAHGPQTLILGGRLTTTTDRAELTEQLSTTLAVASGGVKLIPVRLPVADYTRLREWSREHGFSMAVIIRALVERFLNGQARAGTSSSPET
jgi:hypothetical protein